VILRGGRDSQNFGADEIAEVLSQMAGAGLAQRVVVDASHDNSGKDPVRQKVVAEDIAAQVAAGNAGIVGVMLESFLLEGRQNLNPDGGLVYGQSITDACMDWNNTSDVLDTLAHAVRSRRAG